MQATSKTSSSRRHASGTGRSAQRGMAPEAAVPTSNSYVPLGEEEQEQEEEEEQGCNATQEPGAAEVYAAQKPAVERGSALPAGSHDCEDQALIEQLTQAEEVSTPTSTLEPIGQQAPGRTHPRPQHSNSAAPWCGERLAAARAREAEAAARGGVHVSQGEPPSGPEGGQAPSHCGRYTFHSGSEPRGPPYQRFSLSWQARDSRSPSPGGGAEGSPLWLLASKLRQAEARDIFERVKSRVDELWGQADEARALAAAARERGLLEEVAAQEERAQQLFGTADEMREACAWETYAHLNYYSISTLPRIDLHYLTVRQALEVVRAFIGISWCFIDDGIYQEVQCEIVTGKGTQSKDGPKKGGPKLTPAVQEFLTEQGISWSLDEHGGMVIATLRAPPSPCPTDYGCQAEGQADAQQVHGQLEEGQPLAEGQLEGQSQADSEGEAAAQEVQVASGAGFDEAAAAAQEERGSQLEADVDRVHEAPLDEWETYARQNYTRVKSLPEIDLRYLTVSQATELLRIHTEIAWYFIQAGMFHELECLFVTGSGMSAPSERGQPLLTTAAVEFFEEQGIPWRLDVHGGAVIATLRRHTGESYQADGQPEGQLEGQAEAQEEGQLGEHKLTEGESEGQAGSQEDALMGGQTGSRPEGEVERQADGSWRLAVVGCAVVGCAVVGLRRCWLRRCAGLS